MPGSASLEAHENEARFYLKGSPARETLLPLTLVSGEGELVRDADDREYIDCAAGLLVPCGHAFPPVVAAMSRAAGELEACEDYTNPHRALLTDRLAEAFPTGLGGVQYYSSGTEAVEAGMRLMRGVSGRNDFIGFHGSYHGKTLGSASVAGMKAWNEARPPGFRQVEFCCFDPSESAPEQRLELSLAELRRVLEEDAGKTAGVIVEAIQGGAGVRIPPPAFLQGVQELCRTYNVLLMVDEVFTGMGRTGSLFAYQGVGLDPDLVAVGKGLGNGCPISAILVHERHADRVRHIEGGTTYGGNPVSCAAAVQTMDSLFDERLPERAKATGEAMQAELAPLKKLPEVADVRVAGAMAAIEFLDSGEDKTFARAQATYEICCRDGLLTTPRGATLRLAPPLMISVTAREKATEVVSKAVSEVCESA